ncbi:hypothetical protein MLD38_032403 [Melastoma candidum]|uniref:Uncharacterized protein n=1 Tax=Melastoma candidum TaxID=119954 RepID=A0ACB9M3H7_9MYRT|nr:hypothetical protein MLD38_032403 [Melastoma candidum]
MSATLEEPHPTRDAADGGGQLTTCRGRKKADGGGIRTWFHMTDAGESGLLDVGRYAIRHRTGISACDYRILDPVLAYPPSILGRREAVVVNLGHIKAIITARDVWLLNHKDPAVRPFIQRLKHRTANSNSEGITVLAMVKEGDASMVSTRDEKERASPPFEFIVLEACLENICSSLDLEVKTLEQQAYPTLDELKSKVSDFTLDRIRHIKGRLLFLSKGVVKMKAEVDRLLGNDERMAEMCLTYELQLREQRDRHDGIVDQRHLHVMELERLLLPYCSSRRTLISFLCSNCSAFQQLKDQIHDMEAYVNLILDDKQNGRLNLIIMTKTAHVVLNIYNGFTAAMAMTIDIPFYNVSPNTSFIWVNSAWTAFTIFSYVLLIGLFKHKGWLV